MTWIMMVAIAGATLTAPGAAEFPPHRFPSLQACLAFAWVTTRNIDAARGYVADHPGPTLPKWPSSAVGRYSVATCVPQP